MSSWFDDLSSKVGDLSSKVQASMPTIDKEMIEKLTLTTPEMNAERNQIYEEEQRKTQAKESLAGMLPWETRDHDRDILVEECKEAILKLSSTEETFFGPYQMPALPKLENDDEKDEDEEEPQEDKEQQPSPESLAQLAKLEPLPPLLADFDLDCHVGLIERLLKIDNKLVEKQAKLSGAGDREQIFWKNYFFHCAFTRYEAGLSIDEIWSDDPTPPPKEEVEEEEDDTITFEDPSTEESNAQETSTPAAAPLFDESPEKVVATTGSSSSSNEGADYEMVVGDDDVLDELEAEIARELQD